MKNIIIACLLIFICGCQTSSPEFKFPSDIKTVCYDAKNQSKSSLNSVGVKLKEVQGCKVVKIQGTKKFGPMWAYYSEEWKQYIGGICGGSYIEIACDPSNGAIYFPVLKHEFGHYWLMTNYRDWSHDPKYKDLFYNWYEPRNIIYRTPNDSRSIFDIEDQEWFFAIDVTTNNSIIHIDFVNSITQP